MLIESKDMADILRVEAVTVRKYSDILEKAGYTIIRNDSGRRMYSEKDATMFRQLQELRQHSGMSLEKAAKYLVTRDRMDNETVAHTEIQPIQEQLTRYEERYDELKRMMMSLEEQNRSQAEQNERQAEELKQLHKKMDDQNNNISVILRDVLESKRMLLAAAEQQKKKSRWKFWQKDEDPDPEKAWNKKVNAETEIYKA